MKKVADLDFPIPAPVLEVLREDFRQAVTLSMSPHVGVKPRQLVGCRPTQSCWSPGGFVWIENGKLGQQYSASLQASSGRRRGAPPLIGRVTTATNSMMAWWGSLKMQQARNLHSVPVDD